MQIVTWCSLTEAQQVQLLDRPVLPTLKNIVDDVASIIQAVKQNGDAALRELTKQYDAVRVQHFKIKNSALENAGKYISTAAREAIAFAKSQIEIAHKNNFPHTESITTQPGVHVEKQRRAIERVGLYIPGGHTPLVSTVLMLAVPAMLAHCPRRILCTPPNNIGDIDPHILYAANICGVHEIFKIGGAQAIAAMAYGTETIPKVDKIFGPGNAWVTQAKCQVARDAKGASIDLPAGPSEVLVIADDNAHPDWVALDLLAQAEHGPDTQVILITLSQQFAEAVSESINIRLPQMSRHTILAKSLLNGCMIVAEDIQTAINISNRYAPEHLFLQITNAKQYLAAIHNAGSVFVGEYSTVTLGDYVTGSNHVLPTNGYAKSVSGLSINDFMKVISFQTISQSGLQKLAPFAQVLAQLEGLHAHELAVTQRLNNEEKNVNAV